MSDDSFLVDSKSWLLTCSRCKSQWCPHIREYIALGEDVEEFWNQIGLRALNKPYYIIVPVMPDHEVWARVMLDRLSDKLMVKVSLFVERVDFKSLASEVFLGFLLPGEGRMVIKRMITDWFLGWPDRDSLKCESSTHGFAEEMAWQKSDKRDKLIQQMVVFAHKMCLKCWEKTRSSAAYDDLVPDAGGGSTWKSASWSTGKSVGGGLTGTITVGGGSGGGGSLSRSSSPPASFRWPAPW